MKPGTSEAKQFAERKRLESAIQRMELLKAKGTMVRTSDQEGRPMSAADRMLASERMKRYWRKQRLHVPGDQQTRK